MQSPTSVHLGYDNAEGPKVALFLGKEEGLFRKYDIDLSVERVSPVRLGIPKLLSGAIQFLLGNSGPVIEAIALQQKKLAVIASLGPAYFAIYTRATIKRVDELRNKTFGVSTPGASQDKIARQALKRLGLEPDKDIQIVATGFNNSHDRLRILAKGEVDAVTAAAGDFLELDALGVEAGKVRKLVDLADLGIYVSGSDVAVTRDYIHEHRESVSFFLKALEESVQFAQERPDRVGETYSKYLNIANAQILEHKVKEYYKGQPLRRPLPDKEAIRSHIEELKEKYPHMRLFDVSAFIDESLL